MNYVSGELPQPGDIVECVGPIQGNRPISKSDLRKIGQIRTVFRVEESGWIGFAEKDWVCKPERFKLVSRSLKDQP